MDWLATRQSYAWARRNVKFCGALTGPWHRVTVARCCKLFFEIVLAVVSVSSVGVAVWHCDWWPGS
ncbi:MAG: hypothetical protein CMJ75_15905 [Planctomycetaceae bacterium]|nr:hypothetical protein [Planctomycetaceae bacterium]